MGRDGDHFNLQSWHRRNPTISSKGSSAKMRSIRTGRSESQDSSKIVKASWKALFNFTTYKHLIVLFPAIVCSVSSGVIATVNSYLIGKVFGLFTEFYAGQIDKNDFNHQVATYNLFIIMVAVGSWFFNSLAFFLWHTFSELQARGARVRIFNALLNRNIAWFDERKDGTAALATRLLRQALLHLFCRIYLMR
jgi:ATP-binding cassette, subfamily B (MDR/TAP), member 1